MHSTANDSELVTLDDSLLEHVNGGLLGLLLLEVPLALVAGVAVGAAVTAGTVLAIDLLTHP